GHAAARHAGAAGVAHGVRLDPRLSRPRRRPPHYYERMTVPTLELTGSPFDFGYAHGRAYADAIRRYAAERVAIACSPGWTGRQSSREAVLALAEACVGHHRAFSPTLTEELEGMAAATGLSLAELVVGGGVADFVDVVASGGRRAAQPQAADARNALRVPAARMGDGAASGARRALETKAVDACPAFLVPGARMGAGVAALGQTWDMHEGSTEHLVLLRGRPRGAPAFAVYTTAGAVGMIGMNEAGLSVGINNLMAADGRPGVTWPFVVREMLTHESLDAALAVLARAPLAGGHNYIVMDASGAGANVEAMATRSVATRLEAEPLAHTNHCLHGATRAVERPRD